MYQLLKGDIVLSRHPNVNGAKVSSLFHCQNGDSVTWRKVNGEHQGMIGDAVVFTVKWMKPTPQDKMQPWFDSGAKEE